VFLGKFVLGLIRFCEEGVEGDDLAEIKFFPLK
jgi:hypothetical protein